MTVQSDLALSPAILGGEPAFPQGLPLVRPALGDLDLLQHRLGGVLASGMLTNGPRVRELEEAVAARLGVDHVVAVSSCTAGLALVLQAIGARGPVVMPSFTFAASAHAVVWAGGSPVFADVEEEALTLDPVSVRAALDALPEPPAAISATHVYGTPCRVEELAALADAAGVPLLYDAAHALGSVHRGTPVGSFGVAEVFSLSPTKVLVAGEGGLVATQDASLAEQIRLGRDYGNPGDYDCLFAGLNARMSELHATTALHNLGYLDDHLARRHELVSLFWDAVADVRGIRGPRLAEHDTSTYKDLTLVVDPEAFGVDAAMLGTALRAEGVDSRHYYRPPIHRQQAYAALPMRVPLPTTERLAASVISPPLWSHMTDEHILRLADIIDRIHRSAADVRSRLAAETEKS